MEKNLRDFDTLFDNTRKLTEQLNDQLRRNDVLGEKNRSLEEDLKGSHSELSVSRGEVQRLTRLLENEQRRAARGNASSTPVPMPIRVSSRGRRSPDSPLRRSV